ncbi:MAG: GntR family transcriptional regulator [Desulfobacterales bacterium]
MLNPQSPIPLYHQLADLLLSRIRSGDYPDGSKIPSETELARTYGIGRPTARQATDQLVQKRLLVRKRGSGTYVRQTKKDVDLFSFAGTIASFHKQGITLTTRILEKIRLKAVRNDTENPFANGKAYVFSRLSLVEGTPVLVEDFYLHEALFPGIDRIDMADQSLSRIVNEQYYMRPEGGKQNFRIGHVSGRRAIQLEVSEQTPILMVKRFLDFPQAEKGIYSELFCRTDRFVFSQILGESADG